MSALGVSFDPLGEHLQDPYPFYARARAEEPVFWSPRMKAWVVTRYGDCLAVLHDTKSFSNANSIRTITDPPPEVFAEMAALRLPPPLGVIQADGEVHRRMRAPFARNFTPERVRAATPFVRAKTDALIDAFAGDGHADLIRQLFRPLPVAVVTYMYGIEELDEDLVEAGTHGELALQGNLVIPAEEQAAAAADFVKLCRVIQAVVRERMAAPREDDLPTAFLHAIWPGGREMTAQEEADVVVNLAGLLLPGHETTRGQLGLGVLHLLEHRDQWELLCARPELLPRAVEEICRYDTTVPGMFRVATKDARVGDISLSEGDEVFLAFLSANRDAAFCDRPDVFDVTRAPTRHLAFGKGAHYCAGADTGRRELTVALEALMQRLPGLRLSGHPVEIDPIFVTRGPLELHVEW